MFKFFENRNLTKMVFLLVLSTTLVISMFFGVEEIIAGGTTIAPGITTQITAHTQCRNVRNNHATLSIWVPHLTSAEWDSFILHHRTEYATVTACCSPSCGGAACGWQADGCGGTIWCGDCPAPGAWSTCTYASICATSGTQSRTVWSCSAGACVSSTETQTCGIRSTNGLSCGTSTFCMWNPSTFQCEETHFICSDGMCISTVVICPAPCPA